MAAARNLAGSGVPGPAGRGVPGTGPPERAARDSPPPLHRHNPQADVVADILQKMELSPDAFEARRAFEKRLKERGALCVADDVISEDVAWIPATRQRTPFKRQALCSRRRSLADGLLIAMREKAAGRPPPFALPEKVAAAVDDGAARTCAAAAKWPAVVAGGGIVVVDAFKALGKDAWRRRAGEDAAALRCRSSLGV